MENGIYITQVADGQVSTVHIGGESVQDTQIRQIFAERDRAIAERQRSEALRQARDDQAAQAEARRFVSMCIDCALIMFVAALCWFCYSAGIYMAVAVVAGCIVATSSRFIHYIIKKKER